MPKVRTPRLGILMAVALVGSALMPDTALAICSTRGNFRITSEGPWPMFMRASPGRMCERQFRFGSMVPKRLYLVDPPSNGTIGLRKGGYYSYTPKPSFRGEDAFSLRLCGEYLGKNEGCARLAFSVTVE